MNARNDECSRVEKIFELLVVELVRTRRRERSVLREKGGRKGEGKGRAHLEVGDSKRGLS